jgi:hypothetical protein
LKRLREIDDKLIYALNQAIPTASMKSRTGTDPSQTCAELRQKIHDSHENRGKFIKQCIQVTADDIVKMKKSMTDNNNYDDEKKLITLNRKLRVLQTEEGVEQIVIEKTNRNFRERCRDYYTGDI